MPPSRVWSGPTSDIRLADIRHSEPATAASDWSSGLTHSLTPFRHTQAFSVMSHVEVVHQLFLALGLPPFPPTPGWKEEPMTMVEGEEESPFDQYTRVFVQVLVEESMIPPSFDSAHLQASLARTISTHCYPLFYFDSLPDVHAFCDDDGARESTLATFAARSKEVCADFVLIFEENGKAIPKGLAATLSANMGTVWKEAASRVRKQKAQQVRTRRRSEVSTPRGETKRRRQVMVNEASEETVRLAEVVSMVARSQGFSTHGDVAAAAAEAIGVGERLLAKKQLTGKVSSSSLLQDRESMAHVKRCALAAFIVLAVANPDAFHRHLRLAVDADKTVLSVHCVWRSYGCQCGSKRGHALVTKLSNGSVVGGGRAGNLYLAMARCWLRLDMAASSEPVEGGVSLRQALHFALSLFGSVISPVDPFYRAI